MDSVELDGVASALVHALQVDGRAPFSRIADVLGVSDRTVARRFGRLRAHGLVRVTGVPDSDRTGYAEWLVRLRTRPGSAALVARELARRQDSSWVTVLSGGTEVVAVVRVEGELPLPMRVLAGHAQVDAVDAQRLLRHLTARRWPGRTRALTPEQVAALRIPEPETSGAVVLTDLDRRLLVALRLDGRADFPSLARATGWSESAVRRRVDELRRRGVVRFDVEIDAATLGFAVQAILWLTVSPARLAAVADQLSAHTEVAFAGATTGPHNLVVLVVCRTASDLFDYLSTTIGRIPGIERVESAALTTIVKRTAPPRLP
ncbi:Lrp/AsnC family transcriptional regulator [Nocardia wallacei]|uniref:Lrp/AsnC family transcriptional regulator n=1 Tax=Nocardia wallacei TaxID=480035 RepID=UPI002456269E|nr:Lrp/AsnC family transcriptional regulator [Nocardia wallacei]